MNQSSRFRLAVAASFLAFSGCTSLLEDPPEPPPTREWHVYLQPGYSIGQAEALADLVRELIQIEPPLTPISFMRAGSPQSPIASFEVPFGPPNHRRKEAERLLKEVFDRFSVEYQGGSDASVDLFSLPETSNGHRLRPDLGLSIIVTGSALIADTQSGEGIGEKIWCDGCIADASSPFARMATFPDGTEIYWLVNRPDFSHGPSARSETIHFLRLLLSAKNAALRRLTDSPASLLAPGSQWRDQPKPQDNCSGMRDFAVYESRDAFDSKGQRIVVLKPDLIVQPKAPNEAELTGGRERVAFLLDISGSMAFDRDFKDCSAQRIVPAKADLAERIGDMPMEAFCVIGFGGTRSETPRLEVYPGDWFTAFNWAPASPENRQAAIQEVDAWRCSGGTPTISAFERLMGLEEPPTLIVLISDGLPTLPRSGGAMSDVKRLIADGMAPARVTLHTVGVGNLDVDHPAFDVTGGVFLAEIAQMTGGKCWTLPSSAVETQSK
jgi:hypothetical protein